MKNLFKISLVTLPLLFATTSYAGSTGKLVGKTAKIVKAASSAKTVEFKIDPIIKLVKITSPHSANYEFRISEKLHNRATELFNSQLTHNQKLSLEMELNDVYKYFRKNPLRLSGEFNKEEFIRNQTNIIKRYSYRLSMQQNKVASASGEASKKSNRGSR